ncbi:hypothetical protein AH06_152 [Erwinia phage AH06]|nr:hypothetical protein AH06_152 [Erwinia phage AH06]
MLFLKLFFWSLPFIKKRSKTFMADGATRYNASKKARGWFYAISMAFFLFLGIITWGYRQYDYLSKQNRHMTEEISQLKGRINIYPTLSDTIEQNRLLLSQNHDLAEELIKTRQTNSELYKENQKLQLQVENRKAK